LQALVRPSAYRFPDQQELVVGRLLNLDEVRHLCDFLDFPEKLANALATRKRLRHLISLVVEPSGPGRLSGRPQSIATIGTTVEPFSYAIRLVAEALTLRRRPAEIWMIPEFGHPGISCTQFT